MPCFLTDHSVPFRRLTGEKLLLQKHDPTLRDRAKLAVDFDIGVDPTGIDDSLDGFDLSAFTADRELIQLYSNGRLSRGLFSRNGLMVRLGNDHWGCVFAVIERMTVSRNIAVRPTVGVFLHLIGGIALYGDDRGSGYFDHNASMPNLTAGLEKHLVTDFWSLIIAAFLLIVLGRIDAPSSKWTRLALDSLTFDRPVSLEKAPVRKHIAPGEPILSTVVVTYTMEYTHFRCQRTGSNREWYEIPWLYGHSCSASLFLDT